MDVNRKLFFFFAPLSRDFEQIFGQIVSIRVKTLSNTNLVTSRHIKREKRSLPVDMRLSKTSLEYLNAWNRLDGGLGKKTILKTNDGSTGREILVKTKGECGIRTPLPPLFQTLFNRCTNKYQESNEILLVGISTSLSPGTKGVYLWKMNYWLYFWHIWWPWIKIWHT